MTVVVRLVGPLAMGSMVVGDAAARAALAGWPGARRGRQAVKAVRGVTPPQPLRGELNKHDNSLDSDGKLELRPRRYVADLQERGLLQLIVLHGGGMLVVVEPRSVGVEGRTPALIGQDGRSSVDGGVSRGYDPRAIRR